MSGGESGAGQPRWDLEAQLSFDALTAIPAALVYLHIAEGRGEPVGIRQAAISLFLPDGYTREAIDNKAASVRRYAEITLRTAGIVEMVPGSEPIAARALPWKLGLAVPMARSLLGWELDYPDKTLRRDIMGNSHPTGYQAGRPTLSLTALEAISEAPLGVLSRQDLLAVLRELAPNINTREDHLNFMLENGVLEELPGHVSRPDRPGQRNPRFNASYKIRNSMAPYVRALLYRKRLLFSSPDLREDLTRRAHTLLADRPTVEKLLAKAAQTRMR